jgi:serralysin
MEPEVAKSTTTTAAPAINKTEVIQVAGPLAEAAAFNAVPNPVGPGLPDRSQDHVGETVRGKPVFELGSILHQLDLGFAITPHKGVITYSFVDSAHTPGIYNSPHWQKDSDFTEQYGYSAFTEEQRDAARIAIQNWDELTEVQFKEVNGHGGADITFQNTWATDSQAFAYYPDTEGNPAYKHVVSDVWVADPYYDATNLELDPGFYGLHALNHELGHALGLTHPGDYNASSATDVITYEKDASYYQDSLQYTIMSYFDAFETGADPIDWSLMRWVFPSTPMIHDIYAMQQKYGADMTTRTGDTTYGFNATADVTNEAMSFAEHEMLSIFTIWDAAGNDTLDLSGYSTDSIIDLREGSYSSAGGAGRQLTLEEINANNAAAGLGPRTEALYEIYFNGDYTVVDPETGENVLVNEGIAWKDVVGTNDFVMDDNIGIAYGTIIENAVGGGGDDRINGNQVDNLLTGGSGTDTFIFANDGSVDTITDFDSGVDAIDVTELGVTQDAVSIRGRDIFVTVGTDVVHIIAQGEQVLISDFLF